MIRMTTRSTNELALDTGHVGAFAGTFLLGVDPLLHQLFLGQRRGSARNQSLRQAGQ